MCSVMPSHLVAREVLPTNVSFKSCKTEYWSKFSSHKAFFDWIGDHLSIKHPFGWYQVHSRDVEELGGEGLLVGHYKNSLVQALMSVYPEVEWQPWRFAHSPRHLWSEEANHRKVMDWIAEHLDVHTVEDWYSIKVTQVLEHASAMLNAHYNSSLSNALEVIYPDTLWQPWRFTHPPRGHWEVIQHQQQFLDWVGEQLGVNCQSDWYHVTMSSFNQVAGLQLLSCYNNSLSEALCGAYRDLEWQPWRFANPPSNCWTDVSNLEKYLLWIAEQVNINTPEQWYKVTDSLLADNYGVGVLTYHGSIHSALRLAFPDFPWQRTSFRLVPVDPLATIAQQRSYFDRLGKQLGVARYTDWYSVASSQVVKKGGGALLERYYGGSLADALLKVYPEHRWQPWKFKKPPVGFWSNRDNVDRYLEWVAEELGILNASDWNSVTVGELKRLHGGSVLKLYGDVRTLLSSQGSVPRQVKKSQHLLLLALQKLFPQKQILSNYMHPELVYAGTSQNMQLDHYLPELRLAFEYQGKQHYTFRKMFGPPETQQLKDEQKRVACEAAGIAIVFVPHWWDRTPRSIWATLQKQYPKRF